MRVSDIMKAIESVAPLRLQEEYDNSGLQVGLPEAEVRRVLVTLDITEQVIEEAADKDCQMVVSHHPLIFRPLKNLSYAGLQTEKIIECIKGDIAVMSFHTRLDALEGGVNDALAKKLGLQRTEPLCGMARIGYLEKPMRLDDFASLVDRALGCRCIAYSGKKEVYKVGLLGGEGKDFAWDAAAAGCDTYLTGNAGYNTALDLSDAGINCVEAGHFFTENPVCYALSDMVRSISPDIETKIINSNEIRLY